MKNILVTGGCGFIGSNFIHHLINNNESYFIVNLDKLTYAGSISNLSRIPDSAYSLVEGDICDSGLVKSLFDKYHFDTVVHFAAESHVDRSIDGPSSFIQTNIIGTFNLLEHARSHFSKTKNKDFRFLHVSTDEVYGSLGIDGKFLESTPYNPSSPYSASKAGSDYLVRAWKSTYDLPTLITNCSNNYGPYQFPEKLIPLIIINCLNNRPLPVYGEGTNVRDWLYVKDHCEAISLVLKNGEIGQTYNIGGDNEIKNIDVVKSICSILDEILPKSDGRSYSELISFVQDRPGHDFRYAIDAEKIKTNLGWSPKESFDSGIRETIHWYLDNKTWWQSLQQNAYNQERLGVIKS